MTAYFIQTKHFDQFISSLISSITVVAPTAKKNAFAFENIQSAEQLCLDYDISILPPKKLFFPPKQHLFYFNNGQFEACLDPKNKILLGVHPYDLNAIKQTDFLFSEKYDDIYYSANRSATTLIGSNIQTVAKRAFWRSFNDTFNDNKADRIEDGFLTYLNGGLHTDKRFKGYLYQVFSDKGKQLINFGQFIPASSTQIEQAKKVNNEVLSQCPQQLNYKADEITKTLRQSFDNIELWQQLSEDCFSCGSCNTVCPTCYCFNIEDNWKVDDSENHAGYRTRYWDSCMTEDFAKISSASGHTENFRDSTAKRMRHRIMRKMVYLNDKLGSQACVGCGRCATACTADIADPVTIIDKIMGYYHD